MGLCIATESDYCDFCGAVGSGVTLDGIIEGAHAFVQLVDGEAAHGSADIGTEDDRNAGGRIVFEIFEAKNVCHIEFPFNAAQWPR